jgi:hypothetical protein
MPSGNPPPVATAAARTTQDVINDALRENSRGVVVCYGLAIMLAVVGCFGFVWGAVHGDWAPSLGGPAITAISWPALGYARNLWNAKMMIRLYEIPLANASTADQAAAALQKLFTAVFLQKR